MSNQEFLAQLVQQYPILTDSYNNPNVRYVLEGYLFPATYDVAREKPWNLSSPRWSTRPTRF